MNTDLCQYARPFYPPGYYSRIIYNNPALIVTPVLLSKVIIPRSPKKKPTNLHIEALLVTRTISNPFDMPLIVGNIHKLGNDTNFSYFLN